MRKTNKITQLAGTTRLNKTATARHPERWVPEGGTPIRYFETCVDKGEHREII